MAKHTPPKKERLISNGSVSRRSSGQHSRHASDSIAIFGKQPSLSARNALNEVSEDYKYVEKKRLNLLIEDSSNSNYNKKDEETFRRMVHERQRSRSHNRLEDIELVIFDDHHNIPGPSHDNNYQFIHQGRRKKSSVHNNLEVNIGHYPHEHFTEDDQILIQRYGSRTDKHAPLPQTRTPTTSSFDAYADDEDNKDEFVMINYVVHHHRGRHDHDNDIQPVDITEFKYQWV